MKSKRILFIVIMLFVIMFCASNDGTKVIFAKEGIPFGSIVIDNPTGEPVIQYDVLTEVKQGDTIVFNIDFNSSDKVSINILADGLIKCYEQEYEIWEGKNTLAYESDRDMRYFTIHVKYHGKNLAQRVCEVSNIRLTQDNQAGETAIHLGDDKQQDDASDNNHDTSVYAVVGLVLMGLAVVLAAAICGVMLFVKSRKK